MSATVHTTAWAGDGDVYVRFPEGTVEQFALVEVGTVSVYLTREAVQQLVADLEAGAS
jgi:hypothetical protein